MGYYGDPREQAIDVDNHVIWEQDNRVEERWQWGAMITDLCDMSPEEYMKNPVIETIKQSSQESADQQSEAIKQSIEVATDKIVEAIGDATDSVNDNNDNNTDRIIDAMSGFNVSVNETIYSAATFIGETIHSSTTLEILFYYTSVNSATDPSELTAADFASAIVIIGSDTYFNYILGDPTEEQWQQYKNGEISESELRRVASNDYYIAIPKANKGKMTLNENGTADITDNFFEVPGNELFPDYILYRSIDSDYFNEDYENGERNVKIPFKITIAK